jgi:competence protein ComEC
MRSRFIPKGVALAFSLLTFVGAGAQQIPDSTMVAHFIDVGQGSAALLEFACGAVMIDVGGQGTQDTNNLLAFLRTFFARRTDLNSTLAAILITHNHVDHTRGLVEVAQAFRVNHIIEHGMRGGSNDPGDRPLRNLAATAGHPPILAVADSDVTSGAGLTTPEIDPVDCSGTDPEISILSARLAQNPGWSASAFRNKNNHSLVIRVDFGRSSFLFTGDLEEPAIETLVDFYSGTPMLDADVYVVGHHGSANGTTWSLLQALEQPEIAILSMGPCTRNQGQFNAFQFGHPRIGIVDMLRGAIIRNRNPAKRVPIALGVRDFRLVTMRDRIYGTGWDGTISVRATRSGTYRVNVERPTAPATCG